MVRELARRVPFIDRVVPFPGFPGMAEQFFRPRAALAFFEHMQVERFDLALQMHGSGAYSNPFTLMLGARQTAGFVGADRRDGLLDAALTLPENLPEVARCRALVSMLGAPSTEAGEYLRLLSADHDRARLLLEQHPQPWIGVHPGARDENKVWPLPRYFRVARSLADETGGTVYLLGSGDDAVDLPVGTGGIGGQPCKSGARAGVVDLAGRTSLPQLAALIATLDLFLGNDSGPAHLAYALGTPSLTLFGGTDPERWGPQNWPNIEPGRHRVLARPASCRPCEPGDCERGTACLEDIDADVVAAEALDLLARTHGVTPGRPRQATGSQKVEPAITGGL
jgi:ADP-heptose:LPS heptosyltransferase